jgi:hypothetical protein
MKANKTIIHVLGDVIRHIIELQRWSRQIDTSLQRLAQSSASAKDTAELLQSTRELVTRLERAQASQAQHVQRAEQIGYQGGILLIESIEDLRTLLMLSPNTGSLQVVDAAKQTIGQLRQRLNARTAAEVARPPVED